MKRSHHKKHAEHYEAEEDVVVRDEAPPPQELSIDSTIKDLITASYHLSDDLDNPATPPRLIRMYADRWAINWQEAGIPDPAAQSVIDIYLTVRPVAPATITVEV
jgi:hypothetical protein